MDEAAGVDRVPLRLLANHAVDAGASLCAPSDPLDHPAASCVARPRKTAYLFWQLARPLSSLRPCCGHDRSAATGTIIRLKLEGVF